MIYLKKSIKYPIHYFKDNFYIEYKFFEDILKIKNLQYKDILKIYNLTIESNQIGAFFTYFFFDNKNKYCFNIFLIVKDNFNINIIFNINFDLIKINLIIKYNEQTLSLI